MIEPVRHDWPKIIGEICEALKNPKRKDSDGTKKLAIIMHRQTIQIKRWLDGSEPKHYEGQMLLRIYEEVKR